MSFADNVASRVRHKLHYGVFSLAANLCLARVSNNVNKSLGNGPLYPARHNDLAQVFSVQIDRNGGQEF